ncbi:MAG: UDP-3-O-[3-hydroxymyristoyl] N-acetylglucosamine deacetylase [Planctomycetes bacterium]|nr:UDP-3-O-[3-hydroxymyristoyl] N-acetylglucosamine deacetylase [Planctomycetota bacterium]
MPSNRAQTTIRQTVEISGPGLFSGRPCTLRFCPARADTGVLFVRTDLAPVASVRAQVAHVVDRPRRSTLQQGQAVVETVEHVLSALTGLGVDNVRVELSAAEIPAGDGSAAPFVAALQEAQVVHLESPIAPMTVAEPITVRDGDAFATVLPGGDDTLDLVYDMDYAAHPAIGRQTFAFRLGVDDYATVLAPARTFVLRSEVEQLLAQGVGGHLTPRELLVIGEDGPVDNALRFDNECVRHKMCDLLGDLRLLGRPLVGRVVASRSGHALNHRLVRAILQQGSPPPQIVQARPLMDIRQVQHILPHRYPFLMIDRVIEVDGDRRAVALKNVTINEPFFQGHYPGQPVMPGVLILEALAQLSGILLSRRLDNTGKVAMLISMDRVKIRRSARPGDQLILEAESLHVRRRTGHCRCRALIDGRVAAEAEIKFMLIDEDYTQEPTQPDQDQE